MSELQTTYKHIVHIYRILWDKDMTRAGLKKGTKSQKYNFFHLEKNVFIEMEYRNITQVNECFIFSETKARPIYLGDVSSSLMLCM